MGVTGALLFTHCVVLYLHQIVALSSEKFAVTGLTRPLLTPLGGTLELSCQLSPPQNAQHMEIRWFRNHYTQPVHLYRDGKDLHGEIISKYVERTELIKDAIGEGKVTLRILNVTVDDDGPYHCLFKDGEFYEEHITEVKVTVTSSDIQILMHSPNIEGVMLECHSEGWFPQPRMEWRDSKGEVIPATSKSHSRDGNKLFNMTMALFIKANSHRNVTCYLQNHLTHQEESISIVLSGELFSWRRIWMLILIIIAFVLVPFLLTSCVQQHLTCDMADQNQGCGVGSELVRTREQAAAIALNLRSTTSPSRSPPTDAVRPSRSCSVINSPWKRGVIVFVISMIGIIGVILILHLKPRVPVPDPHFELDILWLEDITVILYVMIVFIVQLVSFIYFRLQGKYDAMVATQKIWFM